ncbi:MAG: response regulator [Armatimonadetes bacterium]|nr:response regulator [Armatimonadota bacterium]
MGKNNILIVDDQIEMLETFADILRDRGYNVFTAEDGYQAIVKVKEKSFDVIFLDIKMPGINGVQTFREIKKIRSYSAVIMMTAFSVPELIKEAIDEGAYAVVYKPFEIEKILQTIKEVLNKVIILVTDDNSADREVLKDILESRKYKVELAKDGYEAIAKVKEKSFDIIFLDIKMPVMNGIKTFEQIHQISPRTPVIMMSGYSLQELEEQVLLAKGAYILIDKPFNMEGVLKIIEEILEKNKTNG